MKHRSDPNNYCVYVHIVPNGKMYIGITGQKAIYRWDNGNGYKKSPLFTIAIKAYGWDNIKHIVLIEGITKELAKECEIALISKYRTNCLDYGYNLALGNYPSEEAKRKNALAHKGNQYHLGFKVSEEGRQKMREAKLGKPLSEAQKAQLKRLHKDMRGRKHNYCNGREKAVIVNGVYYPTITAAANANGISADGLIYYLCGRAKGNRFVCEYAPLK